ncbi:prephenate dehydrogenase [Lactiplantibacillus modestisalitolerans]|uniref:Prephenate dehydrogenase n=1 Tax=Lactiplantibacillus modestisalitolerans TaxID=1457219 RepID=A0ABV5WTZ5_9LACO|nr:prephenate dehydrogenase [Lactiplantibacillus modestisalitolerans]
MVTVVIKGLGLIGSSLARAVKQADPRTHVIGVDVDPASLGWARQHRVVNEVHRDFSDCVSQADFIILAGPVNVIQADLKWLATATLKPGVVVTDVGSTKRAVMAAALPLQRRGVPFIGGHPMAGSHKAGVQAGRADLFANAFYFLVPGLTATPAVPRLQRLLSATQVKWVTVTPQQHDQLVGQLSHLPHVVAAALVNETQTALATSPLGLRLAAGGFKSITRIASSDPTMWTAILESNADVLTSQLQAYIDALRAAQRALTRHDQAGIHALFERAKVTRDRLGPAHQGQLPNFFDLFLNIPDQVGAIAAVTHQLAKAHLNVVNLHLLEVREDVDGVLQLTFSDAASRMRAVEVLTAAGLQIIRKD